MSRWTVNQLYEDIKIVAEHDPGRIVEKAQMTLFNENLRLAQQEFPDNPILKAIPMAEGEVNFGDMLSRVGQLRAALVDS
jgi:hypothetical protein